MKKVFISTLLLFALISSYAQDNLTYQQPPEEIMKLVDAPLAPSVRMNSKADVMLFLYRDAFKSIAELSQKEMRLGGLRINPATNSSSRASYYKNIQIKLASDKEAIQVKGLPQNARLGSISWSPDESMVAFTNTVENGVELWVLDIAKLEEHYAPTMLHIKHLLMEKLLLQE